MGSEPQTIIAWGTHLRAHVLAASVCFVVLGRGEQSCTRGPCPTLGVQPRHCRGLAAPSGSCTGQVMRGLKLCLLFQGSPVFPGWPVLSLCSRS